MKKSRWLLAGVLSFVLILGLVLVYHKKDYCYYLAMGDYVSNKQVLGDEQVNSFSSLLGDYLVENKLVNEVNSSYLKNNMNSKTLLEMIEKDSYKIENSSLSKLIKNSRYITISLGINDVIKQVKYDSYNDKLIYDKDIIDNKIDIFKHNYHAILEEIKDINKNAKVILVGNYKIYNDEYLSDKINDAIKEVALCGAYYVDLSDLDRYVLNENEIYLTNKGQEIVYNRVVECINTIED